LSSLVSPKSAALLVIHGENQGGRFQLPAGRQLQIGRGLGADIRILDTEVSRLHASIHCLDGTWLVNDAGSSNGTFLNGKPVEAVTPLHDGDQIQLGRTVLLFRSAETPADASHRVEMVGIESQKDRSEIVSEMTWDAGRDMMRRASSDLHREDPHLRLLYQVTEEAVHPTLSLNERLQRILDLTVNSLRAHRGCMFVTDPKTDRILPRVVSHRAGADVGGRMPVSRTIVEYVVTRAQAVRTSDALHDARFEAGQSIVRSGIREAMCVPMKGRYELMGVIYLDTTSQTGPAEMAPALFSDEQLALLSAVGRQAALAVENDRYQQALVTAERLAAVGQTIATLSHHVKNILQGIRGGSYLIDAGLAQDDQKLVRKGWKIVERNQDRIYNLVLDMLTYGKEREPEYKIAQVNDVVGEVMELVQARAEDVGISLVVNLSNGIDALHDVENGGITVSTSRDDASKMILIQVADNGPGIPEDELPHLFQLFHSSKGARGTGLGLPVSRKIIEEHGGTLGVDSQPGAGAIFTIRLPIIEDEPSA
jgi:two-component system NtrC family sensor kinase